MLNCKLSDFKERCFYSAETDNHLLPDAYIHYHGLNSPLLHVDGTDEGSSIGVFHASAVSLWSVCGQSVVTFTPYKYGLGSHSIALIIQMLCQTKLINKMIGFNSMRL